MAANTQPILVTGAPRSGTTWVGKMISASPRVGYIPEPLNYNWGKRLHPGMCTAPVKHWFHYICEHNAQAFIEPLRDTLEFRYDLAAGLRNIRSLRDIKKVAWGERTFRQYRSKNAHPLVKDPFAIVSAEWLEKTFGMQVVVLVRHPAGLVSSIKRLNWSFPFSHFTRQPLLMRDHLHPYTEQLESYARKPTDFIDQGILQWNLVHKVIVEYRNQHEDWIFLRHEDVARQPVAGFRHVFQLLDLRFSSRVRSVVQEHTSSANPTEVPPERAFSTRRDSRATVWQWRERLTESEIERIRDGTRDLAREFYSDEDWQCVNAIR